MGPSGWNWWILTFSGCWWAPASINVVKYVFFSDFHSKQDWKTCVNSCSPITMQTNFDSNWLILYISRGPLFWWWIQKSCENVCKGGIIANHTIILWDWFTLWDREEDIQSRRKMTKHFIHDLILVDLFPFFLLCKCFENVQGHKERQNGKSLYQSLFVFETIKHLQEWKALLWNGNVMTLKTRPI